MKTAMLVWALLATTLLGCMQACNQQRRGLGCEAAADRPLTGS